MGKIIAVFSNCGKTHFVMNHYREYDLIDHDMYDFAYGGHFKTDWLTRYWEHAGWMCAKGFNVLINATPEILEKFAPDIHVIYPNRGLKSEYMDRALMRSMDHNTTSRFLQVFDQNWDRWIDYIEQHSVNRHELQAGEYLEGFCKKGWWV